MPVETPPHHLENRTFDEIHVGDQASLARAVCAEDLRLFAIASGDMPARPDAPQSAAGADSRSVAPAPWSATLIATLLVSQFPGPGTVVVGQSLHFASAASVGDTLTATVTVRRMFAAERRIVFDCRCSDQHGMTISEGRAEVLAPAAKQIVRRVEPGGYASADKHARLQTLVARASGLPAIDMAVVHPCDVESLKGALMAAEAGLIDPILVGPEAKIRALAAENGIDLKAHRIVNVKHSHDSAAMAVTLEDKVDIIQNAIDLAHILGIAEPRVAILSAVETVNSRIQSTLDAAALCKMADRGQITGGLLDGPLAFDNAVSIEAARSKGIRSAVAGRAEILVVPDIESGNMVAKQLEYLANALTAGIVLGATVPIVLTSRADTAETRIASCVIAVLIAHASRDENRSA